MTNEPIEQTFVDVNTDNLDDFAALMDGRALPKVSETEEVQDNEVDSVDEDDVVEEVSSDNEEVSDEEPDEEVAEEKPKKSNRFQERINELTARAKEAERALEALRVEQAKQATAAKQNSSAVQAGEPTPDDRNPDGSDKYPLGEFDPTYIRDMARYTIDKEWSAKKEQEAKETAQRLEQESRAALQEQWAAKLKPATEKYEDFLDKTLELESTFDGLDAGYSDYLVNAIKSLDHGPEVLYYFANHLDEAQNFVRMGPLQATLALGEINAKFKKQLQKEPAKVSKAPPPPQVNKGSKTRTAVAADTDDLDAFAKVFFQKR